MLKIPSLPGGRSAIHGQAVLGVTVWGIAAYLSVQFLVRWFQTRPLTPFALYCPAFGALIINHFLSASQGQHPAAEPPHPQPAH